MTIALRAGHSFADVGLMGSMNIIRLRSAVVVAGPYGKG
jgi:hypothetical protein